MRETCREGWEVPYFIDPYNCKWEIGVGYSSILIICQKEVHQDSKAITLSLEKTTQYMKMLSFHSSFSLIESLMLRCYLHVWHGCRKINICYAAHRKRLEVPDKEGYFYERTYQRYPYIKVYLGCLSSIFCFNLRNCKEEVLLIA